MIRKTFKRPLSMLMAVTMLFSNIAGTGLVLAEESETDVSGYETEVQVEEEPEDTVVCIKGQ